MPQHPNVQVHNRMLFGTGYLYHPQRIITNAAGLPQLVTDYGSTKTYPMFFRADVGFSVRWKLAGLGDAILMAEVLNAFNRLNVEGYSFIPVFPSNPEPARVPEVLSGRFFNLGLELHWN
jgi:hypothetical protein